MRRLGNRLKALGVLFGLMFVLALASPHFLNVNNLLNIAQQSAINAILGAGLTLVMIAGGIDLSVGAILALVGIVTAWMLVHGFGTLVAMGAGLSVGMLCGLINGAVTTIANIPPFITTLGMLLTARSLAKIASDFKPISGLPENFHALASTTLGIPNLFLWVCGIYLLMHIVLQHTQVGRYAYAIGGNEQATWLCGINTRAYKIFYYGICGLLAGVAGILTTARLNAASPLAGEMSELYAIAAAVIGGTSLLGGEGLIFGTLIGSLIMGVLRNGLNLLNVPSELEGVVIGLVLVLAVIADRARHTQTPWRFNRWLTGSAVLAVVCVFVFVQHTQTKLRVVFIPKTLGSPFFLAMQQGAERAAKELGVELVTLAPEREIDVEQQYAIVENAIAQKFSGILLTPSGSKELASVVKKAQQANIPIIILDSKVATPAPFVGSDNFNGGKLAGEYLATHLPRGEVAILEGILGHETADARKAGFLAALRAHAQLNVVASQSAHNERARAFAVTQNILQAHPSLRGMFAANDEMALGALEALRAAHKTDVVLLGFDATPEARQAIQAGAMAASVAQSPADMGRIGVEQMARWLKQGEAPQSHTTVATSVIAQQDVAQ
jgi:ribose transport system substrate-binding protein